jgi:hypothetical protein
VKGNFAPPASIRGASGATLERHLPPLGGGARALRRFSPPSSPLRGFKRRGGRRGLEAGPTTPLLGFLLPHRGRVPRSGKGAGAPPRRAVERRGGRADAATRQLKREPRVESGRRDIFTAKYTGPRWGKKEANARSGGISDRSCRVQRRREHLRHRGASTSPGHRRLVFVRPATSTPTPHREHRGHPSLFSPLEPSCDGTLVWRRVAVIYLPGCRPSRRSITVP